MATLENDGYSVFATEMARETLRELRDEVFILGEAGVRCLLDCVPVQKATAFLGRRLVDAGFLLESGVAVQAIAFDKTPSANWKVTWHQDVMYPFSERTRAPGFDIPSMKDGVNYSRPPIEVLSELVAVRLHLDRCDSSNGPLRVCPGSHKYGVLKSTGIPEVLARHGEVSAFADEGDAILMSPLLLHASSRALTPRHRRVLHVVFHSGRPTIERWHRALQVPNQLPDPTSPSVTPAAGAAGAPSVAAVH